MFSSFSAPFIINISYRFADKNLKSMCQARAFDVNQNRRQKILNSTKSQNSTVHVVHVHTKYTIYFYSAFYSNTKWH